MFGIPHPEFGESLIAIIEPQPGTAPTAESVRAGLEGRLARYKIPGRIEFAAELPREDSGKIFKRKLRDTFWAESQRRI